MTDNQIKTKDVTFTIKCTMRERWIPHFLGMLRYMEQLGNLGGSRKITFYSDGDGDFRPKFFVDDVPIKETIYKDGIMDNNGNKYFDAF